jgi:predicted Zn-dependent peptidase
VKPRPDAHLTTGWHFPAPHVDRLDNGLTLWSYELPGQHVASAALVLDLPLTAEPAAREGVATLCARGLDEGTQAHLGPEYAAALEDLGAQYSGWASTSASIGLLEVPAQWFVPGLALFAEAVTGPEFSAPEVSRLIAQRQAELDQLRAGAGRLAGWLLRSTVLDPSHRAARLVGGSHATVAALTSADLHAFHAAHYAPGAATLIVAGDLTPAAARAAAEAAFGAWDNQPQAAPHEPARPAPPARRLIHRPGAVQADIRLGTWGLDRLNPRWAAFQVAATIMGGGFSSRLNQVLREERGWTYDVSITPHSLRQGGWISLGTSTQTATAAPLIEEALDILDLGEGGFSAAEVHDAIGYLVGIAPLSFATADAVVGHAAGLAGHGLGHEAADTALQAIAAVSPDEAEAAWRQLIDPADLSVVVLGDADTLAGALDLTPEPLPNL